MNKKFLTIMTSALLVFTACAGGGGGSKSLSSQEPEEPDIYQFWGKYEESDGAYASFTNAAFFLNLDEEGEAVLDKYNFSTYNASPAAENSAFSAGYMLGTWKVAKKEGVDCLQIKLACYNSDGTEDTTTSGTYYAYEDEDVYSFDLTFPIVRGQSFTRIVTLEGQLGKKYADADAFIQAYKKEFVDPANILKVTSEKGGVAYFQEDGTILLYNGHDKVAEGTWTKSDTALSIIVDDEEINAVIDGNEATLTYTYNMAGYAEVEWVFVIDNFTVLPNKGGEEEPPLGVLVEMVDEENNATLTFNKDKTFAIVMDFGATYGSYEVQHGTWSFANYTVTLTPEGGTAYNSKVADGQFIIEVHINWGGGAIDRDLTFKASQNIIGTFMQTDRKSVV